MFLPIKNRFTIKVKVVIINLERIGHLRLSVISFGQNFKTQTINSYKIVKSGHRFVQIMGQSRLWTWVLESGRLANVIPILFRIAICQKTMRTQIMINLFLFYSESQIEYLLQINPRLEIKHYFLSELFYVLQYKVMYCIHVIFIFFII
jgi:hypothetical protein